MKLIVGLGNIGKEYVETRHNVGFMFLDALAQELDLTFKEEKAFKGRVAIKTLHGEKVWFLKPSTYMNASGEAVQSLSAYYKIPVEDILVIFDDMDLPPGEARFRKKGSSGGQKGMGDIIEKLGSSTISRLKIGIGKGQGDLQGKDYVLSRFRPEERTLVESAIRRQKEGVLLYIKEGIDKAMNEMNRKIDEEPTGTDQ